MRTQITDVYSELGLERPEGAAGGKLTLCLQETDPGIAVGRRSPAVLILPGGAYGWTSPREAMPVALQFLARGWQAFILDYSCAPSVFPTALREAAMAVSLIRSRAAEWGVNPGMLAVLGFSAGGHLAGCISTMYDSEILSDLSAGNDLRPDLLMLAYPVAVSHGRTHELSFENLTGGSELLKRALSLERLVRPDMPPAYMWATRDDGSVPVRNTILLAGAMEECGVDFAMHIFHHGHHGLSTADIMAYPSMYMPDISPDIPNWTAEAMAFAAEKGFGITDEDGVKRG